MTKMLQALHTWTNTRIIIHFIIFWLCILANPVRAEWEPATIEDRLTRLERITQNQSLTDILLQLQRLQDEVQRLRGKLEVQGHVLEAIKRSQVKQSDDTEGQQPKPNTPPITEDVQQSSWASKKQNPNTYQEQNQKQNPEGYGTKSQPQESQSSKNSEDTPLLPPPSTVSVPNATQPPDNVSSESIDYQRSFGQLKSGQYSAATDSFIAFIAKYPNSKYAGNAQYWLGETHYVTRNFDGATLAFTQLLERYPSSEKAAGATLKLGFINHERGQIPKAIELLEQVIQKYPNSTEAKLAQKRLELLRSKLVH